MASDTTTPLTVGAAGITTDDQTNADARRAQGEFVRGVSSARHWITDIPPSNDDDDDDNDEDELPPYYPPESGRYHLIVAYNCPWCHRVLLARAILGLQEAITVDVVYPNRSSDDEPLGGNLWKFLPEGQVGLNGRFAQFPECTIDTVFGGKQYVSEIYQEAGMITDQKSVPILVDKRTRTIVSNESAEMVRMLATTKMRTTCTKYKVPVELYPADKATEIDTLNDWIYQTIANGSYKAGFSSNQDVYETAYQSYFEALTKLNDLLRQSKFLAGSDTVTEADLRLFPPLFRHDPVYYNRFKLNEKYLWEFPNLWRWMGDMMQLEGMEEVTGAGYLAHCKQGYFGRTGNGTIPVGPKGYPECYKIPHWIPPELAAIASPANAVKRRTIEP